MLNNVTIMGRLVRDPEMRYTGKNISVTSFTLAVERDVPGQNGKREVDFIDCVAWRKTAEFVNNFFMKGNLIAVEGSLQMRDWTDKSGNNRRNAEVLVSKAHFSGSKNGEGNAPAPSAPLPQNTEDYAVLDDDDGQLPF